MTTPCIFQELGMTTRLILQELGLQSCFKCWMKSKVTFVLVDGLIRWIDSSCTSSSYIWCIFMSVRQIIIIQIVMPFIMTRVIRVIPVFHVIWRDIGLNWWIRQQLIIHQNWFPNINTVMGTVVIGWCSTISWWKWGKIEILSTV